MKKILYIEHAMSLGGSVMSLSYLLEKIDRTRFTPVVACVGEGTDVPEHYRKYGIEAFACPDIGVFPHTTGGWFPLNSPRSVVRLFATGAGVHRTVTATEALVRRVRPDLVHLNSVVLGPSALGIARTGVPIVWHVREAVVSGHFGIRRRILRQLLSKLPSQIVFISEDERQKLLSDSRGVVIHDFVDFAKFDRSVDGGPFRSELGLSPSDSLILLLGGFTRIKGTHPFLEALPFVRAAHPRAHVAIASAILPMSSSLEARVGRIILPLIGKPTDRQRAMGIIERNAMQPYVHLLPFRRDVEVLIAASDVVVFPSVEPHNARPVAEAGAMGKPVVASRIGGVEELVDHGVTGILTPPGDVRMLAEALIKVLGDRSLAQKMGEAGFDRAARLYNANRNAAQTFGLYDEILGRCDGYGA